jgi:threonine dehydratase
MLDVYRAEIVPRGDAFRRAGEALTINVVNRLRTGSLTLDSGTRFIHPDTGAKVTAGFATIDVEMLREFSELKDAEQIEVVIIGTRPYVYIVPNNPPPKR